MPMDFALGPIRPFVHLHEEEAHPPAGQRRTSSRRNQPKRRRDSLISPPPRGCRSAGSGGYTGRRPKNGPFARSSRPPEALIQTELPPHD